MIFLIGMPGAGKTYWGGRLGIAHNLPFVDLDTYIEQQQDMPVPEIFKMHGEQGFRDMERSALLGIIAGAHKNTIVACGGGTPVFHNNMAAMKNAGCTVYLQAGIELLAQRLEHQRDIRPLLTEAPYLYATLQQMLTARGGIYEQADHILQAENISITNFDQIIHTCTDRH